jgi:dihydroxyacetone synthase
LHSRESVWQFLNVLIKAISLAGHWGLDNLVLIYDDNNVTVDGPIDNCFTDDTSAKLRATGWHVIDVMDGSNDLAAVVDALGEAKQFEGKPVCVHVRTVIGIGSINQGKGKVHGQALGADDIQQLKTNLGFDPTVKYHVPSEVYDYFEPCKVKGADAESEWNDMYARYKQRYPTDEADLARRLRGDLKEGWERRVPAKQDLPKTAQPTRKSSGIMVQAMVPEDRSYMVGSADLLESTFVSWDGMVEFQRPESGLGDYAGRQLRYGIREFAMCAIGNGMAAFQKGAILP